MNTSTRAARARLEPLLQAAQAIRDRGSERGARARKRLVESSGLSLAGVDFALERCLESEPSEAELEALLRGAVQAPAAHVLLSGNVFVAAHRAIAIGLSASPVVHVRSSRREPEMAELLLEGAPDSFRLDAELDPQPGDHLWAYGSDHTLQSVARSLAPGVVLHAHGSGFGVGVIAGHPSTSELERLLSGLAEDIALFDQRGCLSPRLLLVTAGPELARDAARQLATELSAIEARIPRGLLADDEAAAITAYRDAARYAGDVFNAGLAFVTTSPQALLAPIGRNLHVAATNQIVETLSQLAPFVTCCAFEGDATLGAALETALPGARFCHFGHMQRPPFDGPIDRRKRTI